MRLEQGEGDCVYREHGFGVVDEVAEWGGAFLADGLVQREGLPGVVLVGAPVTTAFGGLGCSLPCGHWSPIARVLAASACSSSSCCRVLICRPWSCRGSLRSGMGQIDLFSWTVWQQNNASAADDVTG